MSRRQITIIIVSISIVILVIAGGAMTNWYGLNKKKQSPLVALPDNSIFYIHGTQLCTAVHDFKNKKFWQTIATFPTVAPLNKTIEQVDSVVRNHEEIYRYINNSEAILSLHKVSATKVDLLFISPTKNRFDAKKIQSLFSSKENEKFSSHSFRNVTIYTLSKKEGQVSVAFSLVGGLLVMSHNSVLVEDAIRAYYANINPIRKIVRNKTTLNIKNQLFINFSQFPSLLNIFLNDKGILEIKDFVHFADYGNFNYEITDNDVIIRGNLTSSDSLMKFTDWFEGQKPARLTVSKAMSLSTAIFMSYNLSDYQLFYQKITRQKNKSSAFNNYEKKKNISITNNFLPLIDQNIALAITEPISGELKNSLSIWMRTETSGEAVNFFAQKKDERIPFEYKNFTVYPTQLADIFGVLLGKTFNMNEKAWFVVIRDYLVFSTSPEILKKLADDFALGHTLSGSSEFVMTTEKLASDGNFMVYVNPVRSINIPDIYLNEHWLAKYKNQNFLFSLGPVAFQMSNIVDKTYAELVIGHTDAKARILQKIWDFELDTLPASRPYVVINHNNNKPEILIFDAADNLYLFSSEGQLQWKKPVGSRIIGDLYMIDFYNNNKFQYLFTTKTHLQCIDRLGRNVANYPIRIGNEAITGIGLYCPPKNNQIKYFIGTNTQNVNGYDLTAKPLNGWNAKKINDDLLYPPATLMSGSRLIVYALTRNGSIYMWDSRGNPVLKVIETQSGFKNPFYGNSGIDKDDSYIISLDTSGNTWRIFLNGKTEMTKLANWSPNTWFLYEDINNDKKNELIFIDGSSLVCYNNELSALFSASLQSFSTQPPQVYKTNDAVLLSYYNELSGKLYLSGIQGIPERNFPVDCDKYYFFYDLNKDNALDLIGTSFNKIFVARY